MNARKLGRAQRRYEKDHQYWARPNFCVAKKRKMPRTGGKTYRNACYAHGLEGRYWSRIPASFSPESRIPHFFHRYPESRFFFPKNTFKNDLFLQKVINLRCRLALSIDILHSPGWLAFAARTFTWFVTIFRIPASRLPGSSQIPNPVKIFCVFPNPATYFGQIPDPENTLPDPVCTLL